MHLERDIGELLTMYGELVVKLKEKFPRTDLKFLLDMMSHKLLHPEHKPTTRLEIFYRHRADLDSKADSLYSRTSWIPSIYKSENRVVIEPRLDLEELEAIAQDQDIESLAGDILCCTDSLLSRKKITL